MVRRERQAVRLEDGKTAILIRRFSLTSLAATAFAAFALANAPTAAAQEQLAASCEPPTEERVRMGEDHIAAQTFVSTLTGTLTRVEIAIVKGFESTPGSGDFVVEIRTVDDSTGAPTNVVLASATVADADVPALNPEHTHLNAVFAFPPAVVAGEQYAVSVRRPGAARLSWAAGTGFGADCVGQFWFSTDGGATWNGSFGDLDFFFAVFVTLPPAAPEASCKGEPATHVGTPNGDRIEGTNGPDVIVAFGGSDTVLGGDGEDLICANRGKDLLRGQAGEDKLFGNRGKDRLFGGANSDLLVGGAKGDSLFGGGGKDVLRGGSPDAPAKDAPDLCRGGAANDKLKNCER